jgi:hypothetical protein
MMRIDLIRSGEAVVEPDPAATVSASEAPSA